MRVTHFFVTHGLPLLFVVVMLESFGIPLPGETALIAFGVLASQGHYSIAWVIVITAAAAIIGDNLGYWLLGRLGGRALFRRWNWLRRYSDRVLPRIERIMHRHGGKTVFFGRFVAVLRVGAAAVAGLAHMEWWRFLFWNASGGIVWATSVGLAAFYGGVLDSLLSRITDTFFAIPLLLGAIVFLQGFPFRNIWTVVAAIMILGWPTVARIMRGSVISVKEADFVTAARALGASDLRILGRHILPNAVAPVIVVATISLGLFIVLEATLSFLGIGLPTSTVSWGSDINDAQSSLRSAPHVLLYPSAALSVTVLAFMLLGDAVRDALDPKLR